ncbi:MAG: MBL fold metallo-hydrolase, partial [Weeksellaceae bacterium]
PKRYTDPGVTLEDLPPLDAVLLSHNHYDHMDLVTLRSLSAQHHMPIYTGLGNRKYLNDRGIENVIEMDWWDSVVLGEANRKDEDSQKQEIRGRKNY